MKQSLETQGTSSVLQEHTLKCLLVSGVYRRKHSSYIRSSWYCTVNSVCERQPLRMPRENSELEDNSRCLYSPAPKAAEMQDWMWTGTWKPNLPLLPVSQSSWDSCALSFRCMNISVRGVRWFSSYRITESYASKILPLSPSPFLDLFWEPGGMMSISSGWVHPLPQCNCNPLL